MKKITCRSSWSVVGSVQSIVVPISPESLTGMQETLADKQEWQEMKVKERREIRSNLLLCVCYHTAVCTMRCLREGLGELVCR